MNPNDLEIRDKLLAGAALDAAERERVAAEPELRHLAEALAALTTVNLARDEAPPPVEAAILRHARQRLARRRVPLLLFMRAALAAAALLALTFALRLHFGGPATKNGPEIAAVETNGRPAALVITPGILTWEADAVDLVLFEVQNQLDHLGLHDDAEMRQLIEALL